MWRGTLVCLLVCWTVSLSAWAQRKTLTEHYDQKKRHLHRQYSVLSKKPSVLDGPYQEYYQNGNQKSKGRYQNGKAQGLWQFYFENGNPQSVGFFSQGVYDGYWIFFYESGRRSREGVLRGDNKEGLWTYYYPSGLKRSEGLMRNDAPDSLWTYYHENGVKKATTRHLNDGRRYYQEYYEDGSTQMEGWIREGQSDSLWSYYYPGGALKAQGLERNGQKAGLWKFFWENGALKSVGNYEQGKTRGYWEYFYPNGKVSSKGVQNDGLKEGNWTLFYEGGQHLADGTFEKGTGPYTEYYPSGKVKVKGQFVQGKYTGSWVYFYEDGSKEGTCEYDEEGLGSYTGFYPDGTRSMTGRVENGEKAGVWHLYNKDGSLFGLYKSYKEMIEAGASPLMRLRATLDSVERARNQPPVDTTPVVKEEKPKSSRSLRTQGLVIGVNPLSPLLGSVFGNLEYYIKDRFGVALGGIYLRQPFFQNHSQPERNKTYEEGFTTFINTKLYFDPTSNRTLYMAPEFRYTEVNYRYDFLNPTAPNDPIQVLRGRQKRYEFSFLFGARILRYYPMFGRRINYWTLNLWVGMGGAVQESQVPKSTLIFNDIDTRSFFFRPRLGFTVGVFLW